MQNFNHFYYKQMMFFSHLYFAVVPDMTPIFRSQGRQRDAPWLHLKELCGQGVHVKLTAKHTKTGSL
ncbi:hypothetical protein D2M30_3827 [Bacillus amyloliquefaciens]|nr:hypothetical protein D2M30_3827 [Bacillus amyloliquefaciens]